MPGVVPSLIIAYLDRTFPQSKEHVEKYNAGGPLQSVNVSLSNAPMLHGLLALFDDLPPEHLTPLTGEEYVDLLANVAAIRGQLLMWQHADWQTKQSYLHPLPGTPLSPPASIRRHLLKCPDDLPATGSHTFDFITDDAFRGILLRDEASMEQALGNGEWKAATVLAGSIIEALLLWALRADDPLGRTTAIARLNARLKRKVPDDLVDRKWDLATYVLLAEGRGVIGHDIARGAEIAKGFRNMIHPAAELRREQSPTRDSARVAVGIVGLVAHDVARWAAARPGAP